MKRSFLFFFLVFAILFRWKVDINRLDFQYYLPIFIDGLREKRDPFAFLALQGSKEMIDAAGKNDKLLQVIPQLILPLKR